MYILRNVYFGIVSSHLQYGITAWGNAAAKFIDKLQIQQNYIIKIMTGSSFFQTKLFPIYYELSYVQGDPKATPYSKITMTYSNLLTTFSVFACKLLSLRQLHLCSCFYILIILT